VGRGPYKLATAGLSMRERADWFTIHGGMSYPDGLSSRFICAGAPNGRRRGRKDSEDNWEDRIVEYYHQASCGRKINAKD
jgi:hypothetical protein